MTYFTQWSRFEDGRGEILFRFLISDSYSGLFAGNESFEAKTEVGIFNVSSVKRDLDLAEGKQAADQLSFELSQVACLTDDDLMAFAFALEAQQDQDVDTDLDGDIDITKKERWIYYQISEDGGTTWLKRFLGRIDAKMAADDLYWSGRQFYGDEAYPTRAWKLTATQIEVAVLGLSVKGLLEEWIGGADVVGLDPYDPDEVGIDITSLLVKKASNVTYDFAEYKSRRMVCLDTVLGIMAKLVEAKVGDPSFSISFARTDLPFEVSGYSLKPLMFTAGYYLDGIAEWEVVTDDSCFKRPRIGGTISSIEDLKTRLWVSLHNIDPQSRHEAYSFWRCKTVADLFADIALSLNCFCDMKYTEGGGLVVTFIPRSEYIKTGGVVNKYVYIPDVTQASVSIEPVSVETSNEDKYYSNKNFYSLDGEDKFLVKGGSQLNYETYTQSPLRKELKNEGIRLIFSTGLTTLTNDTVKATAFLLKPSTSVATPSLYSSYNMGGFTPVSALNMYLQHDGQTIDWERKQQPDTGLYMYLDVKDYTTDAENAVTGFGSVHEMFSSISRLRTSTQRTTNGVYETLSELINESATIDGYYYKSEYSLTVPYLTRFREAAHYAVTESIEQLDLGCTVVIGSKEYAVVGIETDDINLVTKLRLHNAERFVGGLSSAEPTPAALVVAGSAPTSGDAPTGSDTDGFEGQRNEDNLYSYVYYDGAWKRTAKVSYADTDTVADKDIIIAQLDGTVFKYQKLSGTNKYLGFGASGELVTYDEVATGLGTMAYQEANDVAITGGSITGLNALSVTGLDDSQMSVGVGNSITFTAIENGTVTTTTTNGNIAFVSTQGSLTFASAHTSAKVQFTLTGTDNTVAALEVDKTRSSTGVTTLLKLDANSTGASSTSNAVQILVTDNASDGSNIGAIQFQTSTSGSNQTSLWQLTGYNAGVSKNLVGFGVGVIVLASSASIATVTLAFTGSNTYTLTLPTSAPAANVSVAATSTSGVQTWQPLRVQVNSVDIASIAAGATQSTTITATGAVAGMAVIVSREGGFGGLVYCGAYVSAADTVIFTLYNPTGSAIDLTAANIYVGLH